MRLFIAEKPNMGRAIAAALGGGMEENGCIRTKQGIVTWCFGHILEQYTPEDYDAKYSKWSVDDLPILPTKWKSKVKKNAAKQFKIIQKLVGEADEIVNAGDPDREGQLLVDEVLNVLNVLKTKSIKRILLNALDERSVKEALLHLQPNENFIGLRNSALARSRADWLIGMNLSRMYTLQARRAGWQDVISVGRVQTPTVGLVIRREIEIRKFQPVTFYTPQLMLRHPKGDFCVKWKVSENYETDTEGRITKKEISSEILQKARNGNPKIIFVEQKKGSSLQKLPYSLSALQIDAGKLFGYSPQEVLDTQQSLYEKKLTSYPRSDCDFLPENQFGDSETILSNLGELGEDFSVFAKMADRAIKSRAWNDEKISAHHAIIPTMKKVIFSDLSEEEKNIYRLIAKRYIVQFYPPQEFLSTHIEVDAGGEIFVATGKVILENGWRTVDQNVENEEKKEEEKQLPKVEKGDSLAIMEEQVTEGITKPPPRFTPATLLKAMKEIHKFVQNKNLAKGLKECSGIGTEATRAGIIEEIKKRGYISLKGKCFVPSELGISLCKILPDSLLFPDITAQWEDALDRIGKGTMQIADFSKRQEDFLRKLLDQAKQAKILPPQNLVSCPKCGKPLVRRRSGQGKKEFFWSCSGYPNCKATFKDAKGKPVLNQRKN